MRTLSIALLPAAAFLLILATCFTTPHAATIATAALDRSLSDIVWTTRHERPNAPILRFPGTPADGHGQHQPSAILGREASAAAGDKSRFPEQNIEPWKAK